MDFGVPQSHKTSSVDERPAVPSETPKALTVSTWTIGRLASIARVGVETIRFYERRGLLNQPAKPAIGYRKYDAAALAQLSFIRQTKQMGFSLEEISRLMTHGQNRPAFCCAFEQMASAKLRALRNDMEVLKQRESNIQRALADCRDGRSPLRGTNLGGYSVLSPRVRLRSA
jgi:MerR family mercuric resistance operon transcriptional regulator